MQDMQEQVRIGKVSTVDAEKRTARIIFEDKDEMVSAELPVLINHPVIKINWAEKKVEDVPTPLLSDNKDGNTQIGDKWEEKNFYNSAPRNLGNDKYIKELPDVIQHKKIIQYGKEKHIFEEEINVFPWLPYVGQMVVAVFLTAGNGDGFIIGGF